MDCIHPQYGCVRFDGARLFHGKRKIYTPFWGGSPLKKTKSRGLPSNNCTWTGKLPLKMVCCPKHMGCFLGLAKLDYIHLLCTQGQCKDILGRGYPRVIALLIHHGFWVDSSWVLGRPVWCQVVIVPLSHNQLPD